jgi:hypothetical protein
MTAMKIDAGIGIWRMVFGALILAVFCDGVGIWMGWVSMH